MLGYSVAKFGDVQVRNLLPERISAWLRGLHLASKTQKHILDSMRQVLETGVEWGYLHQNPARGAAVRSPRQANSEVRPFQSWDEVPRVAIAAGRYGPLIRFACATGLRPEEWIPLTWADIDLPSRTILVKPAWC